MTKSKITIQDKIVQLTELTAWFDSDDFELEQAIEKFQEAEALAAKIEEDLTSLKNNITIIKKSFAEKE